MKKINAVALAVSVSGGFTSSAMAQDTTNWASWVIPTDYPNTLTEASYFNFTNGTTGTVIDPNGGNVGLTLSGEVMDTSADGFVWNLYNGTPAYESVVSPNSPAGSDMLAASGDVLPQYQAHTLLFSEQVSNAVMAFWSLGQPRDVGELTFSQPFVMLSDNGVATPGVSTGGGYTLQGEEGGGVIQFLGTYDTISWTVTGVELYHGFTVGLTTSNNPAANGTYNDPGAYNGGDYSYVYPVGTELGDPVVTYDLFGDGTGVIPPTPFGPTDPAPEPPAPQPRLSVLERVLAEVDGLTNAVPLTGTFVNLAENVAVIDAETGAILNTIDGSVSNTLEGLAAATASVGGDVQAIDQVTVNIGNISTTVLGAVNTGTTALGVNSDYNHAVTSASSAVSGKVLQLGGIADQGALVLNVASNATSVAGSVTNQFVALNGSVGNIGTTVLGAVNTGTIASGVNAITNGIVAGVVGG